MTLLDEAPGISREYVCFRSLTVFRGMCLLSVKRSLGNSSSTSAFRFAYCNTSLLSRKCDAGRPGNHARDPVSFKFAWLAFVS